jgi:UDP-N-acetylmuramoyl-L-alanyl-D-glutamate--2,6-diaminopimelate ligase
MKLKTLLKDINGITIKGSKDIEITGICAHSKRVSPGNLFIAKAGKIDDGMRYIPEVIQAGATAVLTDIYNPSLKNIVQVIYPDVASLEGLLAARYYGFPSNELLMIGITGTNGKTTTSFLVKHLLDKIGKSCGLMGTIEYIIGNHHYQATHTTPDVTTNQKMLREMVTQGCKAAVMEVTSHALDQRRVAYIDYDIAIFSNLTLEHLDYHQSMENYCEAKRKLFLSLGNQPQSLKSYPKVAVVNGDSPWHHKMLEGTKALPFSYGIENHKVDLHASKIQLTAEGTRFDLNYKGEIISCFCPLVGRYNVYNSLAAIAVGLIAGEPLEKLVRLLQDFVPVVGRLEPVANTKEMKIYVDFAHTDDALSNVLECLQELKKDRIITIFGCGGDRDKSKRPKMAKVAEELSDMCIVTSDNPRSEDPSVICQEIVKGFKNPSSHTVILDRKKAIAHALKIATKQDIILIAGKGHERHQIFAHKTVEFDDRKVAAELCEEIKE